MTRVRRLLLALLLGLGLTLGAWPAAAAEPFPRTSARWQTKGIHVKNGEGTAGCIGITAGQMKQVLRYLRPGDKVTIRR